VRLICGRRRASGQTWCKSSRTRPSGLGPRPSAPGPRRRTRTPGLLSGRIDPRDAERNEKAPSLARRASCEPALHDLRTRDPNRGPERFDASWLSRAPQAGQAKGCKPERCMVGARERASGPDYALSVTGAPRPSRDPIPCSNLVPELRLEGDKPRTPSLEAMGAGRPALPHAAVGERDRRGIPAREGDRRVPDQPLVIRDAARARACSGGSQARCASARRACDISGSGSLPRF
jgi:hypothetical protein